MKPWLKDKENRGKRKVFVPQLKPRVPKRFFEAFYGKENINKSLLWNNRLGEYYFNLQQGGTRRYQYSHLHIDYRGLSGVFLTYPTPSKSGKGYDKYNFQISNLLLANGKFLL